MSLPKKKSHKAFSLIELLIVILVISIFSYLIIANISGTSKHANQVIARQQQAELQTALGNWIVSASSEAGGLAGARVRYNETPNKLSLLTNYIQAATLQSFSNDGTEVRSDALTSSKARLYFSSSWTIGSTPTVNWSNLP